MNMIIEYPKGFRCQKGITVDLELWDKFKKHVSSKGLSMTFVLMGLIQRYLEEEKLKDKEERDKK